MVQEFLNFRIISPSTSIFLSPVLSIKKVNSTWRFCVDYKALINVTIKDKYLIPIINELLDELYGAHFSLKWISTLVTIRSESTKKIFVRPLFALMRDTMLSHCRI